MRLDGKGGSVAVDNLRPPPGRGRMGRMRWSRLFDDLEAQLRAEERAELLADVAEHTRARRGQQGLTDRMAADLGRPLRLRVAAAGVLEGTLAELGADWLVLRVELPGARARSVLVPLAAVRAVWGLSGRADPHEGVAQRRLGLRHALRAISRDRAQVRLTDLEGGQLSGTIDRVGRDHVDLREVPEDGTGRGRGHTVVMPLAALALVASAPSAGSPGAGGA